MHERDVPVGQRDRDPGRHQGPLPRLQGHLDGAEQVGTGVAGMGVRRERQSRVESHDRDVHHGRRPYPPLRRVREGDRLRPRGLSRTTHRATAVVGAGDHVPGHDLAGVHRLDTAVAGLDGDRRLHRGDLRAARVRRLGAVEVTDDGLPGRARPDPGRPARHPEVLDPEGTRRVLGVDADARAYLVTRPYLKHSVRVPVSDPDDPAPYWLVATRHPDRLARALTETAHHPGV